MNRFRWVVCQLDALQKCPNIPTLRQALRSLPKTLDETYARMLCTIPEEYSDYAATVLRWLTYALRPMRLGELGELVAVNLAGNPWFDPDARFPDLRDLLDICSSLIQVEQSSKDLEVSFVRLAHFSVKEYLVSERMKTHKLEKYSLPIAQSHVLITAACLAYLLQFEDLNNQNVLVDYPLFDYATVMWDAHARMADRQIRIIEHLILEFLRPNSNPYANWLQYPGFYSIKYHHLASLPPDRPSLNPTSSSAILPPLYVMAMLGVIRILRSLLDLGHDVNEESNYGTAVWAASSCGHTSVVKLLLEQGADPDLGRGEFNPPLLAATESGDLNTVKALVDSGANVDHDIGRVGSILIAACASTHYKIALFLLGKGANIHVKSGKYGNALHAACAKRRAKMKLIRELVSRGVDVNIKGGNYGTPLQASCAHHGNDEVIRFLLTKADPCTEVQASKYGTVLQAICAESHDNEEIVKLLLDSGARRNVEGGKYGTALQAACSQSNRKIVRLLLQKQLSDGHICSWEETDVNITSNRRGSALHAACLKDDTEIIALLLASGADVNVVGGDYGTPLATLYFRHKLEATTALLNRAISLKKSGFQASDTEPSIDNTKVSNEKLCILRMLCEHGAALVRWSSSEEKYFQQLLQLAGVSAKEDIVKEEDNSSVVIS